MLRRLLPLLVAVVGVVVAGLGVASATLWRADDVLVATLTADRPYVVTAPGVLDMGGAPVTVRARAAGGAPVVLAVGRDADVLGWVGQDRYQLVTGLSGWHELTGRAAGASPSPSGSPSVGGSAAASPTATPSPSASGSVAAQLADPAGSDMWVVQATGKGSASLTWPRQSGRWSLLVASPSGTPPTLELAWPRSVTTPYLVPCLVLGGLLVLLGLGWFFRRWRSAHKPEHWTPVETSAVPVVEEGPPRTRRELRAAAQRAASEARTVAPAPREGAGRSRAVSAADRSSHPVPPTGAERDTPTDSLPIAGTGGSSGAPGDRVAARPGGPAAPGGSAGARPRSGPAAPGGPLGSRPGADPARPGADPARAGATSPVAGSAARPPDGSAGPGAPARWTPAATRAGASPFGAARSAAGRAPSAGVSPGADPALDLAGGVSSAGPDRPAAPSQGAPVAGRALPSWAHRAEPGAHLVAGPAEDPPGTGRPSWVPGRSSTARDAPAPGSPPVPAVEGAPRPDDGPGVTGRARPAWLRGGRTAPLPAPGAPVAEPVPEPTAAAEPVPGPTEPVRNRADEWRRTWGIPVSHDAEPIAAPPTTGEESR